jgi:membrane glycosyltransferase
MDIKKFMAKYQYAIIFKIFAVIAIIFFIGIYQRNFAVCEDVKQIGCLGNITLDPAATYISQQQLCLGADDTGCCRYVYPDNQQCYITSLHQSIYAGITGGILMLFAEIFYIIAILFYSALPGLTKYVVYGGGFVNGRKEAAEVTADVFAKAIYFITPVLIVLILIAIYRTPFII